VVNITFSDENQTAIVQFQTRRDAEQAAFGASQMEGVGTLKMSWYKEPTPSSASTTNGTSGMTNHAPALTQSASKSTPQTSSTETAPPNTAMSVDEDVDLETDHNNDPSWKR
jgi:hypothetical protein